MEGRTGRKRKTQGGTGISGTTCEYKKTDDEVGHMPIEALHCVHTQEETAP